MNGHQQPADTPANLTQQLDIDFALQAAGLGVWELNPVTKQLLWDERCRQLFGLAKDSPLSYEQAMQFIHPEDRDRVDKADKAVQWALNPRSDGPYDQSYRTLGADDGQLRWVRFRGRSYFNSSGELSRFAGIAQELKADLTQQVLAQKEVEVSEQLLRDIVMWAPIGIAILNAADLVIESVNDMFIEIAGKPYEQLVGYNYWVPFAEAAPYYADSLNRVAQEGEVFSIKEVELMLIRHGKEEKFYVTFVYMPFKVTVGGIQKVVVWVFENTDQVTQRKLVEEQVAERTEELAAANKELAAINEELTATNEDFMAANQALETANIDLQRSNKNLEQFVYIASHDLQEPLRKIQQFGDLLKSQYGGRLDEGAAYLERMQTAATRMSVLIRDLLAFSRISTTQVIAQPVALNQVISRVLESLSVVVEESGAQVEVTRLPVVPGDRSQLDQLFQNLLSNAFKFRRTDQVGEQVTPQISVKASLVAESQLPTSVQPSRYAQTYHCIEVADNGIGFEEKYLDRMFEVFQRLHGRNEFTGTGIGLAIVLKVVINHGGAITATSKPGQGATFLVYLPA